MRTKGTIDEHAPGAGHSQSPHASCQLRSDARRKAGNAHTASEQSCCKLVCVKPQKSAAPAGNVICAHRNWPICGCPPHLYTVRLNLGTVVERSGHGHTGTLTHVVVEVCWSGWVAKLWSSSRQLLLRTDSLTRSLVVRLANPNCLSDLRLVKPNGDCHFLGADRSCSSVCRSCRLVCLRCSTCGGQRKKKHGHQLRSSEVLSAGCISVLSDCCRR